MSSHTVIIGAGIIGCSAAYYLAQAADVDPTSIHLVEAAPELFASASGKAGGFLAPDWFDHDVAELGALSFDLHRRLAEDNGGRAKWGYSTSTGTSYRGAARKGASKKNTDWISTGGSRAEAADVHHFHSGVGPAWLAKQEGDSISLIGAQDSVAQIDPLKLCEYLLQQCTQRGVHLHQPATVAEVLTDDHGDVSEARIQDKDGSQVRLPCSRVLIAAGAWSQRVFEQLFPRADARLDISALAGHSLLLRSPRWPAQGEGDEPKGCHAVFSTIESGVSPEMVGRIDGDIFVGGLNTSTIPLPDLPTDAVLDDQSIRELKEISKKFLGSPDQAEDLEITREGLCFRPVTDSGRPVVSRVRGSLDGRRQPAEVEGAGGVYVATGHGPWGISLSLGTGLVMSEMMRGLQPCVDVSGLALR